VPPSTFTRPLPLVQATHPAPLYVSPLVLVPDHLPTERVLLQAVIQRPGPTLEAAGLLQADIFTGPRRLIAERALRLGREGKPVGVQALEDGLRTSESALAELAIVLAGDPDELALPGSVHHCVLLLEGAREERERRRNSLLPIVAADDVSATPVAWRWKAWLPGGAISVLEGDPGCGKTTLAVEFAASLSTGRPLPGDDARRLPENSLIISFEDTASTLSTRLRAARADMSRVQVMDISRVGNLAFPSGVALLEATVRAHKIGFVVIDPISAALDPGYSAGSAKVRAALTPIAEMAQRTGSTVLFLRHLTKGKTQGALYRGQGNIAIAGVARAVLALDKHADSGRLILSCSKSSLGAPPRPLGLEILEADGNAPRIEWSGGEGACLPASKPGPAPRKRAAAEAFLSDALASGSLSSAQVFARAAEQGISEKTLRRARSNLRLVVDRKGRDVVWNLPGTGNGEG